MRSHGVICDPGGHLLSDSRLLAGSWRKKYGRGGSSPIGLPGSRTAPSIAGPGSTLPGGLWAPPTRWEPPASPSARLGTPSHLWEVSIFHGIPMGLDRPPFFTPIDPWGGGSLTADQHHPSRPGFLSPMEDRNGSRQLPTKTAGFRGQMQKITP